MKRRNQILSLTLAGMMAAGCLTGCGSAASEAPAADSTVGTTETAQTAEGPVQAAYPLADGDKTLTVYMKDATSGAVGNWENIKAFQVAAEKLGVTIEFIHPAVGSESDQFNLMIASGEYPDVILWDFRSSAMGLDQLVDAGVLLDMNDLIRTYAPNYLSVLEGNETFRKEATSNNGEYLAMYSFSGRAPVSSGPAVRADLLREYGLAEEDDPRTEAYSWADVPHTFQTPFYYVSYAVSAAGALDQYSSYIIFPAMYRASFHSPLQLRIGSQLETIRQPM